MFTVWGPIKQPCIIVLGFFCFFFLSFFLLLWDLWAWGVVGHFLHPFARSPHTPMSSTDVNVPVLSLACFACVAVRSGKKTVLFCEKSTLSPPVFLAVIFVMSTYCRLLAFSLWFSANVWRCMQCHTYYIVTSVHLHFQVPPPLHTHNQSITTTEEKDKLSQQQSFPVLIRGCREGTGSAWVGIGIYTGFYCHLKIHFCHRGILYCMLRLEF